MSKLAGYLSLVASAFPFGDIKDPVLAQELGSLIPRYEGPNARRSTKKTPKQIKARKRAKHNHKRNKH